jgi:hypothetical protein
METTWYFTGLTLLICMMHLGTIVRDAANVMMKTRPSGEKEHQPQSGKRDDWYVFFHCSDLHEPTLKEKSPLMSRHQPSRQPNPQKQLKKQPARMQAGV